MYPLLFLYPKKKKNPIWLNFNILVSNVQLFCWAVNKLKLSYKCNICWGESLNIKNLKNVPQNLMLSE